MRRVTASCRPLALSLVAASTWSTVAAGAPRDAGRVSRSWQGQRFQVRVEASEDRTVTAHVNGAEEVVYESELCVELEADAEVLEVDDAGRVLRVMYRVDRCLVKKDDRWLPVVPRDTIVVAAHLGHAVRLDVRGVSGDSTLRRSLQLVMGFETSIVDDMAEGDGRRPGESWRIAPERAAEAALDLWGVRPDTEDVSGTGSLVDTRTVEDQRCRRLSHRVTARGILPRRDEFPSDFRLESSVADASIRSLIPEDPRRPARGVSVRTEFDATLSGSVGSAEVPVELRVDASRVVFCEKIPIVMSARLPLETAPGD